MAEMLQGLHMVEMGLQEKMEMADFAKMEKVRARGLVLIPTTMGNCGSWREQSACP